MKRAVTVDIPQESMDTVRGIPICDQRLLIRGTRYTAIPVISTAGIHDVFIGE